MFSQDERQEIYKKTGGKLCWLEFIAANDGRLCLLTEDGCVATWWNAEFDQEEQAQAARLCASINDEWRAKQRRAETELTGG